MEDRAAYEKAHKRANAKLGFYLHLAIYVIVNAVLVAINFATSTQYFWFWWPLMGWGIGIFFHGVAVFALSENSPMMQRMIEKEIRAQEEQEEQ